MRTIKSLLKPAIRALNLDRSYTVINITGLALGIGCFIILILYLHHDLTYDQQHSKADRIYRVDFEWSYSAGSTFSATSSSALGPLLKRTYPEVEEQVHFRKIPDERALLRHGNYTNYEKGFYIADNTVFNIFDFTILYGNPDSAIAEPNTIAISETLATRYFGPGNPVGQNLFVDGEAHRVDLVFADLADNSHLKYSGLLANAGDRLPTHNSMWSVGDGYTYVLLRAGYENLAPHYVYPNFFNDHMASYTRAGGYNANLFLEPLADIHLHSTTSADLPRGNIAYLYAFAAVALFVLLVACINYINLTTARSTKRSKEISIRKILGASRAGLIAGYLGESLLFAFLALVAAIGLVELLLHLTPIEAVLGKQLTLNFWGDLSTWLALLALALTVGLLSGIYPALYLSAMATHTVPGRQGSSKSILRECLVLLQFTVSVSVIAATMLMYSQMQYVNSKSLGFAKDNRLTVDIYGAATIEKLPVLIREIEQHPNILSISQVSGSPWEGSFGGAIEFPQGDTLHSMEVYYTRMDENFLETMNISLLSGRNLDPARDNIDREGNRINVLVNRALVNASPWNDATGQFFKIGNLRFNVVGVVEDFHFNNFHHPITPYFLVLDQFTTATMDEQERKRARKELIINIASENISASIIYLQETLQKLNPERPIELKFLDDTLNNQYVGDQRQMQLIGLFAAICIAISCLGLFGLTTFSTQRRTKEIGIRKTLGASSIQLVLLLFRKIGLLVMLGAITGSFIAYFGIQFWLNSFYYRGQINTVVFPLSISLALAVAFITVSIQTGKTVQANPVDSLRHE